VYAKPFRHAPNYTIRVVFPVHPALGSNAVPPRVAKPCQPGLARNSTAADSDAAAAGSVASVLGSIVLTYVKRFTLQRWWQAIILCSAAGACAQRGGGGEFHIGRAGHLIAAVVV
jgi:hypothetical protein